MNKEIIELITENTDQLINFVKGLDEQTVLAPPPSGKWSIIQICDHLMSVDFGVYSLMAMEGSKAPEDRQSKRELINKVGTNRTKKYTSPPPLAPQGKTDTQEKFITKFPSLRNKMITAIAEKDLNMVCDKFSHFVFGEFTFEEWLLFSIQHTNRHKLQMQEVIEALKNS